MLWVSIHEMRSTRERATFCRVTCYGQSASLQDLISQVHPYIIHSTLCVHVGSVARVGVSFRRAGNEGSEERGGERTRPKTAGTQKREGKEI